MMVGQRVDVGKKIKSLRERRGWSQQELADRLGYESDTAIHLIEKGKRGLSIEKLKKVALIFEVSTAGLIGEDAKRNRIDTIASLRADKDLDEEDVKKISSYIDFIKRESKNG